jgi:hypothetical protein
MDTASNFIKNKLLVKTKHIPITGPAFYVLGGEYLDTTFEVLKESSYELYGPFNTYQEAYDKWRERSFAYVDNCHCRFKVINNTFRQELLSILYK